MAEEEHAGRGGHQGCDVPHVQEGVIDSDCSDAAPSVSDLDLDTHAAIFKYGPAPCIKHVPPNILPFAPLDPGA